MGLMLTLVFYLAFLHAASRALRHQLLGWLRVPPLPPPGSPGSSLESSQHQPKLSIPTAAPPAWQVQAAHLGRALQKSHVQQTCVVPRHAPASSCSWQVHAILDSTFLSIQWPRNLPHWASTTANTYQCQLGGLKWKHYTACTHTILEIHFSHKYVHLCLWPQL
jgi:hypothetical protein